MDFSKIKYKPGKDGRKGEVRLDWTTDRTADDGTFVTDERSLKSNDEPHPDFLEALQAMRQVVLDCCYVTPEERLSAVDEDRLDVRGVTIKETADMDGDYVEGFTVTALRELDWISSPLVLHTPFAAATLIPSSGVENKLDTLKAEARLYVNGKRAQGDLFRSGDGAAQEFQDVADNIGGSVAISAGGEEVVRWDAEEGGAAGGEA